MEKPYRCVIELPGLPATGNQLVGVHRMIAHVNALKWRRMIKTAVDLYGLAPEEPLKQAYLKLTRYGTRDLDYDGLVISFKPVVDGLVTIREPGLGKRRAKKTDPVIWPGVLSDDSWAVTGEWSVYQHHVKKGHEHIVIEIYNEAWVDLVTKNPELAEPTTVRTPGYSAGLGASKRPPKVKRSAARHVKADRKRKGDSWPTDTWKREPFSPSLRERSAEREWKKRSE